MWSLPPPVPARLRCVTACPGSSAKHLIDASRAGRACEPHNLLQARLHRFCMPCAVRGPGGPQRRAIYAQQQGLCELGEPGRPLEPGSQGEPSRRARPTTTLPKTHQDSQQGEPTRPVGPVSQPGRPPRDPQGGPARQASHPGQRGGIQFPGNWIQQWPDAVCPKRRMQFGDPI